MKFATFEPAKERRSGPSEAIILFSVSNQTFAIAASDVQEIRSTDSLSGTANEIDCPDLPKVRHTIDRARQKYYVVNAAQHFGLPVSRPTLVLILRQLRAAILVDRIDRMTEISAAYPLPRAFTGDERRWYRGLTYIDDHVIPVVQPAGFLTSQEFWRLGEAAHQASQRELEGARL
ncbi:MAG: chemotaxis protein CheW [Candidatus Acidiferrales bacterium]|jgi:chemotaxis signal transduction protein